MGMIGVNVRGRLKIIDNSIGSAIDDYQIESANVSVDLKPAFYGRFMYMANKSGSDLVTLNYVRGPSSTTLLDTIDSFSIGHTSVGIYAKGRYIWDMTGAGVMYQWDLNAQLSVATVSLPASTYRGLSYDGRFFWTIDVTNGNMVSFNEDGLITGAITAPSDAYDLDITDRFLYVTTGTTGTTGVMYTYDIVTGTQVGFLGVFSTFGTSERVSGITVIEERFIYLTYINVIAV